MRPYLIAIAGPSGSGKTELARRMAALLEAPIVALDSYYRDTAHLPFAERVSINFDEPQSLDHELLFAQLSALAEGAEVAAPVYDFVEYVRAAEVHAVRPAPFVVVEGIFALYWDDVRELARTRVYIDVPEEVCLARRMDRDVRERGRSPESVIEQYAATVQPMAKLYVRPARAHADVVAIGCESVEQSALRVLRHISENLSEPQPLVAAAAASLGAPLAGPRVS
jgi:uridine kinase